MRTVIATALLLIAAPVATSAPANADVFEDDDPPEFEDPECEEDQLLCETFIYLHDRVTDTVVEAWTTLWAAVHDAGQLASDLLDSLVPDVTVEECENAYGYEVSIGEHFQRSECFVI